MNRILSLLWLCSATLPAAEVFPSWRQSGSLFILTTSEGANLPASAEVRDFPLLVRLHRDHFPFTEAQADGADLRFSADGKPLAHEIEAWDAQAGTAAVWVRVPLIRGNERREIRIHWGKTDAPAASDAKQVFNESNGYGHSQYFKPGERENLWCKPVWKANNPERTEYLAELGWWGMDLATRLVESQKVPVFFLNGAKGGTRIDQHQRNDADPTDLQTIYGRMLWRAKQARITHGIRAVLWHQGESDQGADGPDGGYGWESYQRHFVEMSADWKRDFPNLSRHYIYQIWPNACSMGRGHGDMLREAQRTLPALYSNMEILSTLGIDPPGGCHYPLAGWSEFARMVQPLIERDFHGRKLAGPMTPPNLRQARFTSTAHDRITLEFDQPVAWKIELVLDFLINGETGKVTSGEVTGNVVTLKLAEPAEAAMISYLRETEWDRARLLVGTNGLAALTFCEVPIAKEAAPASQ